MSELEGMSIKHLEELRKRSSSNCYSYWRNYNVFLLTCSMQSHFKLGSSSLCIIRLLEPQLTTWQHKLQTI